jgi:hypothetical protein
MFLMILSESNLPIVSSASAACVVVAELFFPVAYGFVHPSGTLARKSAVIDSSSQIGAMFKKVFVSA